MDVIFKYNASQFVYKTSWETDKCQFQSELDGLLTSRWNLAQEHGHFRYHLRIRDQKILPGKYSFLAQLNTDRTENRRQPQTMSNLSQPFDATLFNFTKVSKKEVLFEIVHDKSEGHTEQISSSKHYFMINVSPLEFGHCLLLPSMEDCQSQIVTEDGLTLALHVILLSGTPAFRVAFNSLCAFASVNHLHYHAYYLHHQMLLESFPVKHLVGPCYELVDYPAEGFAFQLEDKDISKLVRDVLKLANFLQTNDVAHNIYITRGCGFHSQMRDNLDTIRIYLWARKSCYGAKDVSAFNAAVCELFGHLIVKSKEAFAALTEDDVSSVLKETCHDMFLQVRESVIKLFNES